jgi:hypothetical protein
MLVMTDAPSGPPVAWEAVSAVLATDPAFGALLPRSPTSVEQIHDHQRVFRIAIPRSGEMPQSLILKCASRWEVEIQSRIARELYKIVPTVYGHPILLHDPAEDLVGMLMEDLDNERMHCAGRTDSSSASLSQQLAAYGQAITALAAVHVHFSRQLAGFPEPKKLAAGLGEAVPQIPELLSLLVSVVGVPLEQSAIKEIGGIGTHFHDYLSCCSSSESLTLTHGDFHPGNVMYNSNGDVRIIDWSAAATGPPEWDLVMCGERQVSQYLQARSSVCYDGPDNCLFYQRLKSAVVVRMYEFIRAAIGVVFSDSTVPFEPLLMSIPLYAGRLIEAASSTRFCGGDPILAACRMRMR